MNEEELRQQRELAALETSTLGGEARERAQSNPHVMELRRRQAQYPQKNAFKAAMDEARGGKPAMQLHGREIPPEWYR